MWGRLYLQMFLFGLLFFLQSLGPVCPLCWSLPRVIGWPVVHWWPCMGKGAFRCSLKPFNKMFCFIPIQLLAPFCSMVSLSLVDTWLFFNVLFPLNLVWLLYLPEIFLTFCPNPASKVWPCTLWICWCFCCCFWYFCYYCCSFYCCYYFGRFFTSILFQYPWWVLTLGKDFP